ncbi:hypothetical protein H9X78_17015, partial [Clostridium saudiense]|nr:hypothetical protein [Clostridium saudiense]
FPSFNPIEGSSNKDSLSKSLMSSKVSKFSFHCTNKSGYSIEVDELRDIKLNGKQWIASLEQSERDYTGIKSLKVGYNKVFGYYIEISKANYASIPEGRYIRKQT